MKQRYTYLVLLLQFFCYAACTQKTEYKSPPGYDLANPEKFIAPESLLEISGIAFYKGNSDTIYAIQDEKGRLYVWKFGTRSFTAAKFSKSGDYEDVAIANDKVVVLRSSGTLFSFPFAERHNEEVTNVQEWKEVLPKNEYEGLYASGDSLFVLCKRCKEDTAAVSTTGYVLQLKDTSLLIVDTFRISSKAIAEKLDKKSIDFHPSAIAKNNNTNEWYIVSSANKLLVITDMAWNVKDAYKLSVSKYLQPEGIAFDKDNNLYISNEGDDLKNGNILRIRYHKK